MRWRWKKLGRIFAPGQFDWLTTHAQNPFAQHLEGDRFRIHFAGRDPENQARGGWIEVALGRPSEVLELSARPSLDLGALGAFDDCGVMPSWLVPHEGRHYLYYTGWSRAVRVPFTFYIGLAISEDGGRSFERFSQAPVLGRSPLDPFLTASPCVLREGPRWRMWYVSGTGWEPPRPDLPKPRHYYHVRYAESVDGLHWQPEPTPCIDYAREEYAIARPAVLELGEAYRMWFSFRGGEDSYRIGYAESGDGRNWERQDAHAGISVSEAGWDSGMVCYATVFEHAGAYYMVYNGNDYGATGIGLAVAVEPGTRADSPRASAASGR